MGGAVPGRMIEVHILGLAFEQCVGFVMSLVELCTDNRPNLHYWVGHIRYVT